MPLEKQRLELKLARHVRNYKKDIFEYIDKKQKQEETTGPVLKWRSELVTSRPENAEILNTSLTSVVTSTAGPQTLEEKVCVDANRLTVSEGKTAVCAVNLSPANRWDLAILTQEYWRAGWGHYEAVLHNP